MTRSRVDIVASDRVRPDSRFVRRGCSPRESVEELIDKRVVIDSVVSVQQRSSPSAPAAGTLAPARTPTDDRKPRSYPTRINE